MIRGEGCRSCRREGSEWKMEGMGEEGGMRDVG